MRCGEECGDAVPEPALGEWPSSRDATVEVEAEVEAERVVLRAGATSFRFLLVLEAVVKLGVRREARELQGRRRRQWREQQQQQQQQRWRAVAVNVGGWAAGGEEMGCAASRAAMHSVGTLQIEAGVGEGVRTLRCTM